MLTETKLPKSELPNLFAHLPREQRAGVYGLLEAYAEERGEYERDEIKRTILEILFPDILVLESHAEPVKLDEGGEARARLTEYRKKVGRSIRGQRQALHMTQQELAKRAGIPQSHVSRLERGMHAPTYLTTERIARALKTKPSQLDPGFD